MRNSASEQDQTQSSLLFDKEWERIQSKTFTHWVNSHLRKRSQQIKDVTQDMRDGKMLNILLEVISGERLPKPETGKMRVHQVMNVSKCLNFVISKNVKLVGIGAEEIVDGNIKMTLGMIWTIILRFALPDTDPSMSARDGLLLWCQKKTEPYKNVRITNFTSSWRDGLAFCAIIHRHRPDLLKYDELTRDKARENLELAFEVAEKHLDIPKMLDVDDLVNMPPDEKSVMTYVSCYYQAFSTSHEHETAANLLRKALDSHLENLNRIKEFEDLSSQINEWLDKTIPEIESREIEQDSIDYFKNIKQDLANFKKQVKPKWSDEKTRLQNAFNSLQTLLRINNRPEYVAPEDLNIGTIERKWKKLVEEETKRLTWINANIKRIENLDMLVKKYNNKSSIHESWAADKLNLLNAPILSVELNELMIIQSRNQTFLGELSSQQSRIKTIQSLLQQLTDLNYPEIAQLQSRLDNILQTSERINVASNQFTAALDEKIKQAQSLEHLRVDYATKASALVNWINEYIEDLGDGYLAKSVSDVNDLIESHQKFNEMFADKKDQVESLSQLEQQIQNITTAPNMYTSYTGQVVSDIVSKLEVAASEHDACLQRDLALNQNRERIANEIIEKTGEIESFQQQIKEQYLLVSGTLEEKCAHTKAFVDKINSYYEPRTVEMAKLIESLDVFPAFLDSEIMFTLENNYRSLLDTILAEVNLLENQILIRDSSSITEKQMDEYKKAFAHFDKDSLGYINTDHFRNFLVSLGYNCTPGNPQSEREFEIILAKVDPSKTDQIFLSNFLNYLATSTKGENNVEEMINSFKILAGGRPYITAEELKREFGDNADVHISKMTKYAGPDAPSDAYDYVIYAESIYGSSDL